MRVFAQLFKEADIYHRCACGKTYTYAQWHALPICGEQLYNFDDGGDDVHLECRNCSCGSTMSVDLVEKNGEAQAS